MCVFCHGPASTPNMLVNVKNDPWPRATATCLHLLIKIYFSSPNCCHRLASLLSVNCCSFAPFGGCYGVRSLFVNLRPSFHQMPPDVSDQARPDEIQLTNKWTIDPTKQTTHKSSIQPKTNTKHVAPLIVSSQCFVDLAQTKRTPSHHVSFHRCLHKGENAQTLKTQPENI